MTNDNETLHVLSDDDMAAVVNNALHTAGLAGPAEDHAEYLQPIMSWANSTAAQYEILQLVIKGALRVRVREDDLYFEPATGLITEGPKP